MEIYGLNAMVFRRCTALGLLKCSLRDEIVLEMLASLAAFGANCQSLNCSWTATGDAIKSSEVGGNNKMLS